MFRNVRFPCTMLQRRCIDWPSGQTVLWSPVVVLWLLPPTACNLTQWPYVVASIGVLVSAGYDQFIWGVSTISELCICSIQSTTITALRSNGLSNVEVNGVYRLEVVGSGRSYFRERLTSWGEGTRVTVRLSLWCSLHRIKELSLYRIRDCIFLLCLFPTQTIPRWTIWAVGRNETVVVFLWPRGWCLHDAGSPVQSWWIKTWQAIY